MPLLHPRATAKEFIPEVAAGIVLVHLAALAAPFTFSWPGFYSLLILYVVTGCLGITLCYHRLLSHRSFKTNKAVKYFLMLCGAIALQGSPASWSAIHRLHHKESDQERDPHSPLVSFLWSHVLWVCYTDTTFRQADNELGRFVPDLINDPWAKFLDKNYFLINALVVPILYAIGYLIGGHKTALSVVVWGGFLRIVMVWHFTWFVNSVTHLFGYRNYTTRDDSRNLWWVALVTFGEGWHNNHHASPSTARSGHRWWEFDFTYGILKVLEITGLAWKVHPIPKHQTAAVVSPITSLSEPEKIRV